jgi:hypothetical protein
MMHRNAVLERVLAHAEPREPLLADVPRRIARDGCTAAILLAHGFKSDRLVELINSGLAGVTTERRYCRRPGDASYPRADNGRRQAGARSTQGAAMTATMFSLILKRAALYTASSLSYP